MIIFHLINSIRGTILTSTVSLYPRIHLPEMSFITIPGINFLFANFSATHTFALTPSSLITRSGLKHPFVFIGDERTNDRNKYVPGTFYHYLPPHLPFCQWKATTYKSVRKQGLSSCPVLLEESSSSTAVLRQRRTRERRKHLSRPIPLHSLTNWLSCKDIYLDTPTPLTSSGFVHCTLTRLLLLVTVYLLLINQRPTTNAVANRPERPSDWLSWLRRRYIDSQRDWLAAMRGMIIQWIITNEHSSSLRLPLIMTLAYLHTYTRSSPAAQQNSRNSSSRSIVFTLGWLVYLIFCTPEEEQSWPWSKGGVKEKIRNRW